MRWTAKNAKNRGYKRLRKTQLLRSLWGIFKQNGQKLNLFNKVKHKKVFYKELIYPS